MTSEQIGGVAASLIYSDVSVPRRVCPFFQALPWLRLPMAQLEQQGGVATGCEELLLKQDSVL